MMKKITLLLTVLAFVAVSAFGAKPPATVTIDAAAKKQPAVKFAHDKHITRAKTCDRYEPIPPHASSTWPHCSPHERSRRRV